MFQDCGLLSKFRSPASPVGSSQASRAHPRRRKDVWRYCAHVRMAALGSRRAPGVGRDPYFFPRLGGWLLQRQADRTCAPGTSPSRKPPACRVWSVTVRVFHACSGQPHLQSWAGRVPRGVGPISVFQSCCEPLDYRGTVITIRHPDTANSSGRRSKTSQSRDGGRWYERAFPVRSVVSFSCEQNAQGKTGSTPSVQQRRARSDRHRAMKPIGWLWRITKNWSGNACHAGLRLRLQRAGSIPIVQSRPLYM